MGGVKEELGRGGHVGGVKEQLGRGGNVGGVKEVKKYRRRPDDVIIVMRKPMH